MAALEFGRNDTIVESTTLQREDCDVALIHARPEGLPTAGIVIHPDIFGNRALFEDIAARLASHGFAVACVEPFARVPAAQRLAASEDVAERMTWVKHLDDRDQLGDLEAAANLLVVQDDVARVGVLGFCMGGMYALKAAQLERFDAAVAFYGMVRVPEAWRGSGVAEPLDGIETVCPTLAIFGSIDTWTPPADVEILRNAWSDRSDCEVVVIEGADHGFVHAPERPVHRPDDATRLWSRTLEWLK